MHKLQCTCFISKDFFFLSCILNPSHPHTYFLRHLNDELHVCSREITLGWSLEKNEWTSYVSTGEYPHMSLYKQVNTLTCLYTNRWTPSPVSKQTDLFLLFEMEVSFNAQEQTSLTRLQLRLLLTLIRMEMRLTEARRKLRER